MSDLDNIEELEALLAELDDLDEPPKGKPEPVAEKVPVEELSEEDLAELGDLDELEAALAESEKVSEPVAAPEPTPVVDAEVDGLDDVLAEIEAAKPIIEAEPAPAVAAVARRGRSSKKVTPAIVAEEEAEEPGYISGNLKTFIDPDQLQDDLEVSETNLSKAMIRQAPLFARYSALAAKAQFQADRADQQVDLVEANLDSQIRDDMVAKGIKITENLVKAAVIRHPDYQKAVTRYNEAKAIAEMVKTAADSFRHRRDMLIQMGADRREEMKGAVRVQEHPGAAALRTINGEK